MTAITQLFLLLLRNILVLLLNPIFWLIILIVSMQYRKMRRISQSLFRHPLDPVWPAVLLATLFGVLGGIVGSILMLLVGVSVLEVGLTYLWVVALVLMLIQQRFLCFSYAGGVIAISNLLFGFPQVSIPHVMGLVAILHLVEALLIYFTGPLFPVPVYLKTKEGQIVGGYNLQKFWPLPLVALVAWYLPNTEILVEAIKMPDWWPLIQTGVVKGQGELVYAMAPVLAALGYGDIAISQRPRQKTRRSAWELACYSLILLALAILASRNPAWAFLAAFFGPLGHEALIIIDQKRELSRKPIFVPPTQGIKVLHVLRKSPLYRLGVRSGDVILRINSQEVNVNSELYAILWEADNSLEIEYLSGNDQILRQEVLAYQRGEALGLIPIPQGQLEPYLHYSGSLSLLQRWWLKYFRRK